MQIIDAHTFLADRAWGNQLLLDAGNYTARIHWTDQAYRWHENRGDEVFVVLDGEVDLHHFDGVSETVHRLTQGQIALIPEGERHVARPRGEARILVLEQKGSD